MSGNIGPYRSLAARIRVHEVLEATTGGTRRHVVDLVRGLDANRFDVTLACANLRDPAFGDDLRLLTAAGHAVTVVPMVRTIHPLRDLLALSRLLRLFRRTKPTIVHTHSSKAGFLGRLAARIAHVPIVIHTPHVFAFEMVGPGARRGLYRALERKAAAWTDRIVCVCSRERDVAMAAGLLPADRVVVIHNGVDDNTGISAHRPAMRRALGVSQTAMVVGSIGRLTRQKDFGLFVEIIRRLVPDMPGTEFVIIGEGEERDGLVRTIHACALGRRCRVIAPGPEAAAFHPALDVFVMCSRWEGLPYTLLDAMAAGTAIVSFDVGGVAEALDEGACGLLVPAGDVAAMADGIRRLVGNPGERERLGLAARGRVTQRFKLDAMLRRTEQLYEACLAGRLPLG